DLLSIEEGQAQFSVKIPESSHAISVAKLFINLKRKHDAIFIGYAPNGLVKEMVVNPPLDVTLNPGDTLFYIAERRINAINWSSLDAD
ncbi:MAG: two pore domain potassium channel family protein, partial [Alteromonas macleodii]|nr:two pore domain potassium channel family protein [Alteromonas macleodii]